MDADGLRHALVTIVGMIGALAVAIGASIFFSRLIPAPPMDGRLAKSRVWAGYMGILVLIPVILWFLLIAQFW